MVQRPPGGSISKVHHHYVAQGPIADSRPKSEYELAILAIKRLVMLMCRVGKEAFKVDKVEFASKVCTRAIEAERKEGSPLKFGPPPTEVEGALLLSEAAYTKAI